MKTARLPASAILAAAALGLATAHAQRGPVPGLSTATPYLIHYGNWTPELVAQARLNYRLVILHPASNITPAGIATIRSGPDATAGTADDVKVLGYLSVGEDDRPEAPFEDDGNGPRVDPRPSYHDPLTDAIDPLGDPSPGGTGYASYYLDDDDFDGSPDQNSVFGGYYVNPGDPAWHAILKARTKAADGSAGIDELLTTTHGAGYGCDGLFLDTLDTPAPNSFGATYYEWTAKAYRDLVKRIGDDNPGKLLLANRGLFFHNPNLKTYAYTLRPHIDLLLFESYYTDSSGSGAPSAFFDDNRFNYAPKLNAEAGRADGFTVLGLGYVAPGEPPALGPEDFRQCQAEQGWLLYRTNPALDALPFSTDAAAWNAAHPDTAPPVWDSTAAAGADSDPTAPGNQPPPPRTGIQQAVPGDQSVTVRWDVARDQTGPVHYRIYHTTAATLDFGAATVVPDVRGSVPAGYASGTAAGISANEFTVAGLQNGTTYQFAVRAVDALGHEDANTVTLPATPGSAPAASHYATIAVDGDASDWAAVPAALVDPAGDGAPDVTAVKVANDDDYLYVLVQYAAAVDTNNLNGSPATFLSLENDADGSAGYDIYGLGVIRADVSWQNDVPFAQRHDTYNLNATFTGADAGIAPYHAHTSFQEYRIARNATFNTGGPDQPLFPQGAIRLAVWTDGAVTEFAGAIDYVFAAAPPVASHYATIAIDGDASDWAAVPVTHVDPAGDGAPDVTAVKVANDDDYLYLLVHYAAAVDTNTLNGAPSTYLSLENPADGSDGYDIYGLGAIRADVSWQNDFPFAQDAATFNLGATFTNAVPAIAPYAAHTAFQEYRIARNATFNPGGPDLPLFPHDLIRLAVWTDGAATEFAGAFDYQFASAPPPPAHFTHIEVDGDAADWAAVPAVIIDPEGDGAPDVTAVKVANDDDHLYLLVQYAAAVDTNLLNGAPSTFLSLENDADGSPGYDIYGLGAIRADVSWQNDYPFAQDAATFNLGATFTNGAAAIAPYAAHTAFQEYRIARNATRTLGGPALPVFPQDLIRLAVWTDGAATEFAGGQPYQFAANPGADAYQAWKLNRFTAAELADPALGGDAGDLDRDGVPTLMEYALGGDPRAADPWRLPAPGLATVGASRHLTFRHLRRNPAAPLVYAPQTSLTLDADWNDDPSQFTEVSVTPRDAGLEEVLLRLNSPVGSGPRFVRLKVTRIP